MGLRGAAEAAGMAIVVERAVSADDHATPSSAPAATTDGPPASPPTPTTGAPAEGASPELGDDMVGVTVAAGESPAAATPAQDVAASAAPPHTPSAQPQARLAERRGLVRRGPSGGLPPAATPRAAAGLPPLPPPPTRPAPGAARSAAFAASVALPLGVAARMSAATDRRQAPARRVPGAGRRPRPALAVSRLGAALASPIRKQAAARGQRSLWGWPPPPPLSPHRRLPNACAAWRCRRPR